MLQRCHSHLWCTWQSQRNGLAGKVLDLRLGSEKFDPGEKAGAVHYHEETEQRTEDVTFCQSVQTLEWEWLIEAVVVWHWRLVWRVEWTGTGYCFAVALDRQYCDGAQQTLGQLPSRGPGTQTEHISTNPQKIEPHNSGRIPCCEGYSWKTRRTFCTRN